MSHYVIGFFYSFKQLSEIKHNSRLLVTAILALLAFLVMIKTRVPDIFIYFGLHMALTDSYLQRRGFESESVKLPGSYFFITFMTTLTLYFLFFRLKLSRVTGLPYQPLSIIILGSCLLFYALYFVMVLRKRQSVPKTVFIRMLAFETTGFIAIPAAFLIDPTFVAWESAVLYHVLFWLFIPYAKPEARKNIVLTSRFLLWNGLLTIFFLAMTPFFHAYWKTLSLDATREYLIIWGYFHVNTSFFLSSLNPRWLLRFAGAVGLLPPLVPANSRKNST